MATLRSGLILHLNEFLQKLIKIYNSGYLYLKSSDVDPDWLYADPDPQNLMNMDPDPLN